MSDTVTVPSKIADDRSAVQVVFLILEDWSCGDLSVSGAYAKIVEFMALKEPA